MIFFNPFFFFLLLDRSASVASVESLLFFAALSRTTDPAESRSPEEEAAMADHRLYRSASIHWDPLAP